MGHPVENVSHVDISVISNQIKPSPNIATHIPNVLMKLLLRTSSLLTLFILVRVCIYIFIYFLVPNSSWSSVVQLTLTKLFKVSFLELDL